MPRLPDARLRKVVRHAIQMGPDERRLFLFVETEDGEKTVMGPFDREALIGMIANYSTRYAGAEVALLVDPDTDVIRLAYDGYSDDQDGPRTG